MSSKFELVKVGTVLTALSLAFMVGVLSAAHRFYKENAVAYAFLVSLSLRNQSVEPETFDIEVLPQSSISSVIPKKKITNLPPGAVERYSVVIKGEQVFPGIMTTLPGSNDVSFNKLSTLGFSPPSFSQNILGVEQAVAWVAENLSYEGFRRNAQRLEELAITRVGDCTEYSVLLQALLVEAGFRNVVPVDGIYMVEQEGRQLSQTNLHSWVMVELDRQWFIADPLYQYVGPVSSSYIITNRLRQGQSSIFVNISGSTNIQVSI